jgi:hypothetical protein
MMTTTSLGSPRNLSTILESVNNDDDDINQHAVDAQQVGREETKTEEHAETDEDGLGKSGLQTPLTAEYNNALLLAHLQKDWQSKVYAFFESKIGIVYVDGQKCHKFTCNVKHCKW